MVIVLIIVGPMLTGVGEFVESCGEKAIFKRIFTLFPVMVLARKIHTITIVLGPVVIPAVLSIWAMSTNMVPAVIRHPEPMKYLPKIRAIDRGGVRIFSYLNRFCSAPGTASSHRA